MHDHTHDFLSRTHTHFINGKWYARPDSEYFTVENPATEETITKVAAGTKADVDLAVQAARTAFEGVWKATSPLERTAILNRFGDSIRDNADLLADVETSESGTPRVWSYPTMLSGFPSFLSYYAGWPTKILGDTIPAVPLGREDQDFLVYTNKEPIGVVGAITPWNSPAGIFLMKLAPALAAGCTVVVKTPELAPLTTALLAELAFESGLPAGVLNMVHGLGAVAGAALSSHPDVDKISFTGSTATGKLVLDAAKSNLKKVSLELGGKSPFVVMADANLDEAAPAAAVACFGMSGQNCMAATRIFVHSAVFEEFMAKLDAAMDYLKVGNGFDEDVFIGPLISRQQKEKVLGFIAAGQAEGAVLHRGGKALPGPGHWVEPTVFTKCTHEMTLAREEIFGPVMTILEFDDDLDALNTALNDTRYGLSGSVWSKDIPKALKIARLIDSGQVAINAHAAISAETPFGGNRQSGWGRELGREGLEEYLKTKAISIRLG
jgi:phenylacetaldehyde dehydrogenase